jgi:hypothetical protein
VPNDTARLPPLQIPALGGRTNNDVPNRLQNRLRDDFKARRE